MRKIYVGFSKPRHKILPIYSWLIRLVEGTKFSHVYVMHNTKYDIGLVYQASGVSVNFTNHEVFLSKNEVVNEFEFDITDEAFDKYMRFAMTNAGKPYGMLQVLGIAICFLFNLKRNPFRSGRADYVCSELVGEILFEICGFKYDHEILDKLLPIEVYDFCLKYGKGIK